MVGAYPPALAQLELAGAADRLTNQRALPRTAVTGITTTSISKQDAFGALKLLMQQGRLALPRHPTLLRQLSALEFTTTETGVVRIAVPERSGHDDLAMALALAAHALPTEIGPKRRGAVLRFFSRDREPRLEDVPDDQQVDGEGEPEPVRDRPRGAVARYRDVRQVDHAESGPGDLGDVAAVARWLEPRRESPHMRPGYRNADGTPGWYRW